MVIISPKFHAEMAGEGIQYSWGITKGRLYRRGKPLNSKRSKDRFKELVLECTSRDILELRPFKSFRDEQGLTYYYVLIILVTSATMTRLTTTRTLPLIERLVKAFKTHRAAIEFDAGFVNAFVPKLERGSS